MEKERIDDYGSGFVVVSRVSGGGQYAIGAYELDTYCLGVRHALYYARLTRSEHDAIINTFKTRSGGFETVPYNVAHNWVWGAVDFASEAGIAPAPEFSVAKYLLEDDEDESIPLELYPFGDGDMYHLIGPPEIIRKYRPILEANLKEEQYMVTVQPSDIEY